MLLHQTAISLGDIEEGELMELLRKLETVTRQAIQADKQIVISTDSPELSAMLNALADSIHKGETISTVTRKNGHGKPKPVVEKKNQKKNKPTEDGVKLEPTRGPHVRSIKISSTGEMISRYELNRRLDEYVIDIGTEVHSPKYGELIVTQKTRDDGARSLVVVNEAGEEV